MRHVDDNKGWDIIIFFTKNIGEPYEREGENVVFDENIGG
jgi:hypothetical protein